MTIRGVQGWHRGEILIHERLGFASDMLDNYTWIKAEMPDQHREFHSTRLPFIPVTTLDDKNRPWSSIFAGRTGEPGFVTSPGTQRLDMEIKVWEGDPFLENSKLYDGHMLVAGIGIEFSTRRRNKFAGHAFEMEQENDVFRLKMVVNEAIGNCPKYINVRTLDPYPNTVPVVAHKCLDVPEDGRMPDELCEFVRNSDTIFIGSSYEAQTEDADKFPSHVGQNQRGGRRGWVRVRNDGRTLVIPDYSGNRVLSSLGNIEATPVASVSIVDFVTGDVLYVTGTAHTAVGKESQVIMPRQAVVTLLEVTGYIFVRDALPVRQRPGTETERSPYSPPVRMLAEEDASGAAKFAEEEIYVTLTRVRVHSDNLATFTWEATKPLTIRPGQTAALDFSEVVGKAGYQHMASMNPSSVNDDRVRTWTISSAHLDPAGTKTFDLTMRKKEHGAVTGALFVLARKLQELKPDALDDARSIGLRVRLVGIAGEFALAIPPAPSDPATELTSAMLWLAGGIGLTPFMSMLSAISGMPRTNIVWDAVLAVATREPEVLLPLIAGAIGAATPRLRLVVHIYSSQPCPPFPALTPSDDLQVTLVSHKGRIDNTLFEATPDAATRTAYMCGPGEFESAMVNLLTAHGITEVVRESFEY